MRRGSRTVATMTHIFVDISDSEDDNFSSEYPETDSSTAVPSAVSSPRNSVFLDIPVMSTTTMMRTSDGSETTTVVEEHRLPDGKRRIVKKVSTRRLVPTSSLPALGEITGGEVFFGENGEVYEMKEEIFPDGTKRTHKISRVSNQPR
ncbi:hypothetical protein HK096_006162 [Nowakowskiella sp. JEL0078]|nr:hypothetical protein HK096_006162 [Nowakowskiella sp. JEL0078]